MDNRQFARLDILSEKAFNEIITPDELNEYFLLLDEWNIHADQNFLDKLNFTD